MRKSTIGIMFAVVWSLYYAIVAYGVPGQAGPSSVLHHLWNAVGALSTFWCIFWLGEWVADTRRSEATKP